MGIILTGLVFFSCTLKNSTREASIVPETKAQQPQLLLKEPWEMKWAKALSVGRQEGLVLVYTSAEASMREELRKSFTEKFGIKLAFVVGSSSEMANKIRTERNYGLYLPDAYITGYTTLINVVKPHGDILEPIEPILLLPEVIDTKAWLGGKGPYIDKDKMVIGMAAQFMRYLTRNTELIKEGEITSFPDLLKPQYKGKMILRDPTGAGTGNAWVGFMVRLWGLDKTQDYLRQFVQQEPVITRDIRLQLESLAHGKYALGVGTSGDTTAEFIKLGAPLASVRTTHGGVILPGGGSLGLPSKQAHPNAAIIFINWLLSREGQSAFVRGYGQPTTRLDVSSEGIDPSLLPQPGEAIYMADEESAILQGKLTVVAREIFLPIMR